MMDAIARGRHAAEQKTRRWKHKRFDELSELCHRFNEDVAHGGGLIIPWCEDADIYARILFIYLAPDQMTMRASIQLTEGSIIPASLIDEQVEILRNHVASLPLAGIEQKESVKIS